MADIFLKIVNMSISASWIVLAVLLLRLLLKKAPKWITVLLWGIVAIRLICPFSIESVVSLIPSTETISPEIMMDRTPTIDSGVPIINNIVNPMIGETFTPDPIASANPLQILIPVLAIAWIVGIVIMLAYTAISYFRVKSKIGTAVLFRDNIYQSENVVSPFVLGIIKPKIYLPFNMNEQDMEHVIAHENAHICRKDHWWKPFGFLVLTLHWFNPLMWLGYVLLCRDIELACDEKVVKEFNNEQKADYSQALLTCSVNRRIIAACPLAFGEVGVKNRVKSVLNYKKPAFWIVVAAIVVSIAVAVCFLTNPRTTIDDELSVFLDMQIAEHHYSEGHTDDNFITVHHKVLDVDKGLTRTTVYMWVLYHEYSCENGEIKLEAGAHAPTVITAKRTGSHGHYELVEYWTPRDGSYYADDIKEKFPWHLHSKALDSQRYIGEQKAFCENAAKEYFREDTNFVGGPTNIGQLKEKYPQFFNVSTDGGLTVYVWQMSKDNYSCYLANTSMEAISDNSFAYDVGTTIAEMRTISTTYDIDQKDITIQPVINPLSSYYYEIDDAYRAKIKELFWQGGYQIGGTNPHNQVYDVTLSYANWTDDSKIYTSSLNLRKMQSNSIQHLPIYKFDSLKDLKQFKESFGDILTMDSGWDEVPSFNEATAKYDTKFFEENSLMLVYVSASNCTHRFGLGSIGWDEKSFCINVVETTGKEFVDAAMAGWFLTVAIEKETVASCTEFDADLNNEIKLYYPAFSYAEDSAIYIEGQPGVKTSGFVNTSEIKIGFENIAEHAKKECTIKYYTTQTYFDSSAGMWKVVFNDENILGGDQTVYMTKNGVTTLIVYGE